MGEPGHLGGGSATEAMTMLGVPATRPDDPLAEKRRLVEVRRIFAERAQREADAVEGQLHELERERDRRLQAVADAQRALDADAVRGAKEAAHQAFRTSVRTAATHRDVEVSAAAWLDSINSINAGVRAARLRVERERAHADRLLPELGRLAKAAASARATADNAAEAFEAACAALQAGDLELAQRAAEVAAAADTAAVDAPAPGAGPTVEPARPAKGGRGRAAARPARVPGVEPAGDVPLPGNVPLPGVPWPAAATAPAAMPPSTAAGGLLRPARSVADRWAAVAAVPPPPDPDRAPDTLRIEIGAVPECVMLRLLRRDRRAMLRLVARIAGPKPAEQSRVQILVSEFVDAVFAAAIDAAFFAFPLEDPFWEHFSKEQSRDIVLGLAALGHRYDGLGGFADDRVPNHRDLALALGHAGLNPTRIRQWPDRDAIPELYRQLHVEADAFLAERAPALTLGELVRLLGRRAERLADLWNDWARVRPLLLSPD